jgi:hypothetical protein
MKMGKAKKCQYPTPSDYPHDPWPVHVAPIGPNTAWVWNCIDVFNDWSNKVMGLECQCFLYITHVKRSLAYAPRVGRNQDILRAYLGCMYRHLVGDLIEVSDPIGPTFLNGTI